jgi:uncharacterized RDD family membrane protein YckC
MSKSEVYIDEVLHNIVGTASQRRRVAEDLREHFRAAAEEGKTEEQVIESMGTPLEVARATMEEASFHFAGFWHRLLAFALDFVFCLALVAPVVLPVGLLLARVDGSQNSAIGILALSTGIVCGLGVAGVFLLYFPLLEGHFGQTLGKRLTRTRVITESGEPIGFGQAFLRRLSFYFEFLWLDALFVPFTPKRQRALDIVAKTIVVRDEHAPVSGLTLLAGAAILAPFLLLVPLIVLFLVGVP